MDPAMPGKLNPPRRRFNIQQIAFVFGKKDKEVAVSANFGAWMTRRAWQASCLESNAHHRDEDLTGRRKTPHTSVMLCR